jgi:hypothetical protein
MTTRTIRTREAWLQVAIRDVTDWLHLAAAPTFGFMALFTVLFGGGNDLLCTHGASPPSSMVWMYALMSAFHSTPWLRLIAGRFR